MPQRARLTSTRASRRPRDPIRAYLESSRDPRRGVVRAPPAAAREPRGGSGRPARPAQPGTSPSLTDLQLLNDGELAMLGDVMEVLERRIQLAEAQGIDITRLSNRASDHS
jgi:hypothetical protein